MTRRRHTPEQVIRKLREADRLLAEGGTTVDAARHRAQQRLDLLGVEEADEGVPRHRSAAAR